MLSSEYGWTTEYIFTRTAREIDWRIRSINKRIKVEAEFKMRLNGIEPISEEAPKLAIDKRTEDEKKAMEIALERAKKRKRLQFNEG